MLGNVHGLSGDEGRHELGWAGGEDKLRQLGPRKSHSGVSLSGTLVRMRPLEADPTGPPSTTNMSIARVFGGQCQPHGPGSNRRGVYHWIGCIDLRAYLRNSSIRSRSVGWH